MTDCFDEWPSIAHNGWVLLILTGGTDMAFWNGKSSQKSTLRARTQTR
jgi:hypothetical protein